jgi:serine/threonine-protein kinase
MSMPDVPNACLSDDCLLALAEGRLDPRERQKAERHVDGCDDCRRVAAALAFENEEDTYRSRPPVPTEATETDRRVLPNQLRSRYTLLRQIGSGPNGALFIASDRAKGLVAVKWIHAELAEADDAVARVEKAVEAARSFRHPNVLRVRGAHYESGVLLVVSLLGESGDVSHLLASQELAPKLAEDVIRQTVAALAAAHGAGVTHGDLKPENVLVDLAGHVFVTDFGLGRALRTVEDGDTPRSDLFAFSGMALALLEQSRHPDRRLRSVLRRCHEDPRAYSSAVELEAAVQGTGLESSESEHKESWTPALGEVLSGRYRILGLLGSGGMGVVMTAHDIDSDRQVAVKMMPPRMARRRSAVERLLREARAASAIESDHVVRIFEAGTGADSTPYLVMEHLGGKTLGELITERGPLPVQEAVDYVLQACVAVAECHARGIVHRDLKPDNVMVLDEPGRRGSVKILDFGISKADWLAEDSVPGRLTATVDVLGTPTYMSPEQVRSSSNVDGRTDMWSLGVILYEALTGRPPFVAHNVPALAAMIVSDDPEPLPQLRGDVPGGLSHVVLQCLAKHPDRRIGSAHHLAERLVPFAASSSLRWLHKIRTIAATDVPRMTPVPPRPRPAPVAKKPLPQLSITPTLPPLHAGPNRMGVALAVGAVALAGVLLSFALFDSEPTEVPAVATATAEPPRSKSYVLEDPVIEPAAEIAPLPAAPPPRSAKKTRRPRRAVTGPLDDRY